MSESYLEWQQKRGLALDVIDWALEEYRLYRDDFHTRDADVLLARIASRLSEVRAVCHDPRAAALDDFLTEVEMPDGGIAEEAFCRGWDALANTGESK